MAVYKIKGKNDLCIYMNGTMLCKIWYGPHIYGVIFDKKGRGGSFPLLTKEDKKAFKMKENTEIPSVKQFAYTANNSKREAYLQHIEDGKLIYRVQIDNVVVEFPIPLEETKGGTFNKVEKATLLKRFYIKALEEDNVKVMPYTITKFVKKL